MAAWGEDPTQTGSALACVDLATGKLLGLRYGPKTYSHCGHNHHYADGRLYIMNSGNGTEVFLIEPGPAMTLRGRLPIPAPLDADARKELYAMPVVAGTTLLLRRRDELMAFDVGAR